MFYILRLLALLFTLLLLSSGTFAYVPAYPTNDTEAAKASGLNFTEPSSLELYWPGGMLQTGISHRIAGKNNGAGRLKGAFVHLSEPVGNGETTTPWIAYISCDVNATDSSDVFNTAYSKGAVAVLLYSLYSTTCIIDPAYMAPIDVFVSTSKPTSALIINQFSNADFIDFDAKKLNDSASYVNDSLIDIPPSTRGYLISWLVFYELGFTTTRLSYPTPPTNSNTKAQAQATVTSAGTTTTISNGSQTPTIVTSAGTTTTNTSNGSQTPTMSCSVFTILFSMMLLTLI